MLFTRKTKSDGIQLLMVEPQEKNKKQQEKKVKIKYYCEKHDPDFENKMHDVLVVYKQVSLQFEEEGKIIIPDDKPMIHTISCDEKPGIQAIATTSDDLRPGTIMAVCIVIMNISVLERCR